MTALENHQAADTGDLALSEKQELIECELIIGRGLQTYFEVGSALMSIRDNRLYRAQYSTFEEYCEKRWDMSKTHANRQIGAAEVYANLTPIGVKPPANEAQARALASLPQGQQQAAWQAAVESAPNGKVTAAHVEQVASRFKPAPPNVPPPAPKSSFYVGQTVYHAGRRMIVAALQPSAGTATLKSWLNGLRQNGVPFAEIQTETEHLTAVADRQQSSVTVQSWPVDTAAHTAPAPHEPTADPSLPDDASAPAPAADTPYVGALVLNPIGEVFQVLKLNDDGTADCVDADGEKFELTTAALTVADPATKLPTIQERLKQQFKDAGLRCFRVVAHRDGLAGTFSAGIFTDAVGDAAWAEAYAQGEAVRALGYQVLSAGVDTGPGYKVMGFGGQPAIFVHFAPVAIEPPARKSGRNQNVHYSSESDQRYSPSDFMERVRAVLGPIDLDPASCAQANRVVAAERYYDRSSDGLKQPWDARNVYLNPPYGDEIDPFIVRIIDEYERGAFPEGILLVPARTDTQWFQRLKLYPRCFITGRLKFWNDDDPTLTTGAPFPSAVFYFGPRVDAWAREFSEIGHVYVYWEPAS